MNRTLAGIVASAAFAAVAADQTAPAKAPRFAPLTFEQLNTYQKPLGEQILKVSSVGLGGPYNPLLRSPVLGQRMFDLLYYLRWNSSLPLRLNEMAILITGRIWRSQVEWYAHGPLAIKAIRATGLVPNAAKIMQRNYYGWFRREGRGVYALCESGRQALATFAHALDLPGHEAAAMHAAE